MTEKQKLIERLIAENAGKVVITQNRAMTLLGVGKTTFYGMMDGYTFTVRGKNMAKAYLVDDVAEAFLRRCEK